LKGLLRCIYIEILLLACGSLPRFEKGAVSNLRPALPEWVRRPGIGGCGRLSALCASRA
jgi:hypothetical protein